MNGAEHHRRSIRLEGYDYSLAGAYFVTLCAHRRACLFGEVVEGVMEWSHYGQVAAACWRALGRYDAAVSLDVFILMPNHLHGIISLSDPAADTGADIGRGEEAAAQPALKATRSFPPLRPGSRRPRTRRGMVGKGRPRGTQPGSLGAIIHTYKAESTRRINRMMGARENHIWQRNYYERIIRNEREYEAIRQYIINNPIQWAVDCENPVRR